MTGKEIRLSAVEYLNTWPFIHGLESEPVENLQVTLDHPARCAQKLIEGNADIGLVPIAAWDEYSHLRQVTNFGIAGDGPVASVLLVGDVEVGRMEHIILDYQSRTSNELLKLLVNDYLGLHPQFRMSVPGFEKDIKGSSGGLLIGDRALKWRHNFKYCYDLSAMWKDWTGLPFLFAAWMANDHVGANMVEVLETRFKKGLIMREDIVTSKQGLFPYCDLRTYLFDCIIYELSQPFLDGRDLFLSKIKVTETSI